MKTINVALGTQHSHITGPLAHSHTRTYLLPAPSAREHCRLQKTRPTIIYISLFFFFGERVDFPRREANATRNKKQMGSIGGAANRWWGYSAAMLLSFQQGSHFPADSAIFEGSCLRYIRSRAGEYKSAKKDMNLKYYI